MVKAPEKFVDEYLSQERRIKVRTRKISAEETKRLKKNAILLWDIYNTPEIKEILSEKEKLHFMDMESDTVHLCLSYVEKGILAEYEQDMGSRNDLAGAHIYKQSETLINRYFYNEKGIEELSKTKNTVIRTIAEIMMNYELPENDIWDAIAKGRPIHLSKGI